MILLEFNGQGLEIIIALFAFFILGLPIIVFLIGLWIRKNRPKAGKVLMILSTVYFIIAAGTCGLFLSGA
tara:strand:- start:534 stop:743 length:210 start_codon:yes stop_codon:yes gene_type:complete